MNKDTQLGSKLTEIIKSNSVVSVAKEYLEIGIDAILESGTVKDIPLVNTVTGVFGMAGSIRDNLFSSKLIRFLNNLSTIPQEERISMIEKLNEDNNFSGKVGVNIIEIIERMESDKKPELAAKCFSAFAQNQISFEELRRIMIALERIPSFDIDKLENFSKSTPENPLDLNESALIAFVNSGLGVNNGGFGGGVIIPTNLCHKFVLACLAS